ncbi:MAG: hypothetical protein CME64_15130 [Halobacteriovoraceae bacterium]|nr:hypothetical protein [Halobacteriovoraceae bacterium]|tara:strand:+ start:68692 stop:69654 length:963 start_codon:yes stop_codon:yes gene_type:complete
MNHYYFIELDIKDEQLLSAIEAEAFKSFGCEGVQEFTLEEEEVDRILGERSYSGGDLPLEVLEEVEQTLIAEGKVKRTLYFSDPTQAQGFIEFLRGWGLEANAKAQEGEVRDWNENWKKNFKTIEVTSSFSIVPSWEKKEEDGDKIFIYPGMGFGTGNHETTFLCLKLMLEEIEDLNSIKTCLDFGCGSGILGIGASRKSQSLERVDYLDIDQEALNNTEYNIGFNSSAEAKDNKLLLPSDSDKMLSSYDLVFANILKHTLLEQADTILSKTGKYLIVSGLLKGQEQDICVAYKQYGTKLEPVKTLIKNDWSAVLFKRGL